MVIFICCSTRPYKKSIPSGALEWLRCRKVFVMNFEFVFSKPTRKHMIFKVVYLPSPLKQTEYIYMFLYGNLAPIVVFGIEISAGCLLYIPWWVYFCWFLIVEWWYSTVEAQITVKSRFFENFFENLEWFWARKICLVYSLKINYHNFCKKYQRRCTHQPIRCWITILKPITAVHNSPAILAMQTAPEISFFDAPSARHRKERFIGNLA